MTTLAIEPGSILAVDDDRDDVDLLRLLLRKTGLPNPLQVYREGEQAVTALSKLVQNSVKALRPLLCLIDVKMPSMSGHDLLRWIRGQPALDALPVVILSSSEHPRDIQQAAQEGAQCYLSKYPQPALLREVVHEAERFVAGTPAEECFRLPSNLLLVRCRRLTVPRDGKPTANTLPLRPVDAPVSRPATPMAANFPVVRRPGGG